MSKPPTKKARLYRDEVKDRHTSHWDMDMLSREELENLMSMKKPVKQADVDPVAEENDKVPGSPEDAEPEK